MNLTVKKANFSRSRGQALPLMIAATLALSALLAFTFKVGRTVVERTRVRHRADITAFSGAVDYSRALNLLAYSEKGLGLSVLLSPFTGGAPIKAIQQTQKYFAQFAPYANALATWNIGRENGLFVVPFWNIEKPVSLEALKKVKPDYNVQQRTLTGMLSEGIGKVNEAGKTLGQEALTKSEKETEAAAEGIAEEMLGHLEGTEFEKGLTSMLPEEFKISRYSYKKKKTGEKIRIEPERVKKIDFVNAAGKPDSRYADMDSGKFVKESKGAKDLPLDTEEIGPHSITLLAWSWKEQREASPWTGKRLVALSKVQVGGGNLDILADNSAEYGPYFVPVFEKTLSESFLPKLVKASDFPGANSGIFMAYNDFLKGLHQEILNRIPQVLH